MNNQFMLRALELASRGKTTPNPMVGAVLVKKGQIIAEGYHSYAGGPHAEVVALRKAGEKAKGADLYVTLEPCCHVGRTPPCTDAIIQSGVSQVFAGMKDPNKRVHGKGIRALKAAGIKVSTGLMKKDCEKLNEVFVKVMKTGMPFVTVKTAMSLDGKIATRQGDSQWISGVKSRDFVHGLRDRNDAILVGTNTILKDNPQLTCRLKKKRCSHPARIILDQRNRIPLTAKVFANSKTQRVIYVSGLKLSAQREKLLTAKNIEILKVKTLKSGFDLNKLMKLLVQKDLNSILIEGGGDINSSAFAAGIVDRVFAFISPILVGGQQAPSPIGGKGVGKIAKAMRLENMKVIQIGEDLMVEAVPCSAE
jgi:diaminohydroxyphosphoribosylaminopyrimidine deaminase / 5-amino-6-(5-phosphoribosylamino)uracil reductase